MAEYKRKRRSAFKSAPKARKPKVKQEKIFEDIEMTPHKTQKKPEKNMKVLRGKKYKTKRRSKAAMVALTVILIAVGICQLLMPAGIIEPASNMVATIGGGSYPITVEGSETLNVSYKTAYYYLLTNKTIEAYSNSGKKIFSYNHGFENPVLKTSKTRALVFGQNTNQALIFNLKGLATSLEVKENIKNAAIGDNGTYALVTSSGNYAAQVSVYKKNGDLLYEWFSSKDLVNNVAVSPNGKKIAVSTLDSAVGTYNSKLSVLGFSSATPEYEKLYENTIIYTLDSSFSGGFSALTSNAYSFVKWSNFKTREYKNDYNTAMFRVGNNGVAVVYNRESNKTDNRIAVFTKNGKLKTELEFKGIITDYSVKNHHIYCVSDTKAYILDNEGGFMRQGECGFGASRVFPLGQNAMAVITDNEISKIKLEQE
jgi:hypothetical protein